jgi:23S rRNA pseudouridine1911/1915/1917 synthase
MVKVDSGSAPVSAQGGSSLAIESVPDRFAGERLDRMLAEMVPERSRATLQEWIRSGLVLVDGRQSRPRDRLAGGERVLIRVPAVPVTADRPEVMALAIVHEDPDLLVIDKPAGLVVHPGAGNPAGTLLNALLHHDPALADLPRAGIVHRLDKDTSGLMVVARNEVSRQLLIQALAEHHVERVYDAVVHGLPVSGGRVDAPMGRHRHDRVRMAVRGDGRPAVTHYRVVRRFRRHALLRVSLETGRTHQIRVHLAHVGHPLLGDPVYGGRPRPLPGAGDALADCLRRFRRQALHAGRLRLVHPCTGADMEWRAPPPPDLAALLAALERDFAGHGPDHGHAG